MRTLKQALFAAALIALASTGLRAQPGGDGDDAGGAAGEADVTLPMSKEAQLSTAEMRSKSDEFVSDMQSMLSRVVELQQLARRQKDVIKLNCVNDKLLQVKQLLNIAEGARTDLVEAEAQDDLPGQQHQYGQIKIAHEKISGLRDEAEACIGEELVYLGDTEVTVDQPDVTDDPTDDDDIWDGGDTLEPPGYASPFN